LSESQQNKAPTCESNNINKFKEKFRSHTGKTFSRLATEDVLGTSHVAREVLQAETGSLGCADRRWFKGSTGGK
jgi:hypothetical protein